MVSYMSEKICAAHVHNQPVITNRAFSNVQTAFFNTDLGNESLYVWSGQEVILIAYLDSACLKTSWEIGATSAIWQNITNFRLMTRACD